MTVRLMARNMNIIARVSGASRTSEPSLASRAVRSLSRENFPANFVSASLQLLQGRDLCFVLLLYALQLIYLILLKRAAPCSFSARLFRLLLAPRELLLLFLDLSL